MTVQRSTLYPEISPYRQDMLDVGDGHRLYWEACGNPDGVPVVFLHGGPGAGSAPVHRRFFDPDYYNIIIFDQRGSGRSVPHASLRENNTQNLIGDIEMLRRHLGVKKWLVFGGSWGSTLGLAYGQAHPDSCHGFVLRGVFTGRQRELDWFIHDMGRIFPEARKAFLEFLPEDERDDPAWAYYTRLTDPDPDIHLPAARSWSGYESRCSSLLPSRDIGGSASAALSLGRMEAHYFVNRMFLEEGQLLDNVKLIQHLPAIIVQGRYDIVCPPETASELASRWPIAELHMVPDAGHSAMETGTRAALVSATERFKQILG
jgi:proline iminopeptidase